MSLSLSQLKSRVAKNLYYRTMSLVYGIKDCAFDYPNELFQDDMLHIDLMDNCRSCMSFQPNVLPNLRGQPFYPSFERRQPIIVSFGTCVQLPINTCGNSCGYYSSGPTT